MGYTDKKFYGYIKNNWVGVDYVSNERSQSQYIVYIRGRHILRDDTLCL